MRFLFTLICILHITAANAQQFFYGDTTRTWEATIEHYTKLATDHRGAHLFTIGTDDDGSPMHLFVISDGSGFTPDSIRASGKNILWITNGIHPGEPDGIDASIVVAQALLENDYLMGLMVNTAVCIVPVYNISGAKNRSSTSRANQNGPKEYGFRGNARNLDLNRDFIKTDSKNAKSLIAAMTYWDPDVYLETHVSNGADHQYVMELLTSQGDKQDPALQEFTTAIMVPRVKEWMKVREILMCPYFETVGDTPEDGLSGFVDGPRYSTGHSTLRQRIGILSETHMLKPYEDRVNATIQMEFAVLAAMNEYPQALKKARDQALLNTAKAASFGVNWELDTTQRTTLPWQGYKAEKLPSRVSQGDRIHYDHNTPTDTLVPWLYRAKPAQTLIKPKAYLIPQEWHEVIARLELDGVPMEIVGNESNYLGEVYYIAQFQTVKEPYEGHYLHHHITTRITRDTVTAQSGDRVVPMGNATDRLVIEILEPQASDSYFAWGFFDSILQQKEWFSAYVFEDIAADLLANDPELKAALAAQCAADEGLAKDAWSQLYFVYQRSPYFEKSYRRYPVVRLVE